jgi:hypothetical protein
MHDTAYLEVSYRKRFQSCLDTSVGSRLRLKCDGTRAENRFRLSAKRTSPFKSAGASVQSTTGSRGVRISVSNDGHTMFRGSVKGTGYPLRSPVSLLLPLPCVTVCHHISTGLYLKRYRSVLRYLVVIIFIWKKASSQMGVDPKNTFKRSAIDGTQAADRFSFRPRSGLSPLCDHLWSTPFCWTDFL